MIDYIKLTLGVALLVGFLCLPVLFVWAAIDQLIGDPLSCECVCERTAGCEIHEFEHAICAIGPGKYSCCTSRTQ